MSDHDPNEIQEHPSEPDDKPTVLSVIRGLQDGTVSAKTLSITSRRACVEHLTGEGYSVVEIAEILKVSERTVARDRQAIHVANAVQRDPALVGQVVGRLTHETDLSISRMRRVAREKKTTASVKVEAEHRCYQVYSDFLQNLQRLGYLPTAAHEIRADLMHHVDHPPSFDEMLEEVAQLELALGAAESTPDESTRLQITELKTELTKYSASAHLSSVKQSIQKKERLDDERP